MLANLYHLPLSNIHSGTPEGRSFFDVSINVVVVQVAKIMRQYELKPPYQNKPDVQYC